MRQQPARERPQHGGVAPARHLQMRGGELHAGNKFAIGEQIESRRSTARFDGSADAPAATETVEPLVKPTAKSPEQPQAEPEEKPAEESYTERLLKAKRQVWQDRGIDTKDDKQ